MSAVVFITPNIKGRFTDDVLGTLQLATILDQQGVDCEILPFFCIGETTQLDTFLDYTVAAIEERKPKVVSFYTRCDTYHIMLKMAQRIKACWPEIYIVMGGPQSDITAEETLRQIPYVDYICCGEGENTIYPFFSSLLQDKPDTTTAGLVYRENGAVKKNPRPELLQDLDTLPMINYSFFHYLEKTDLSETATFPIDVGRGCPFGCTYCSTKSFWGRKYRLKSPERIIAEVKQIHQLFGVSSFSFSHDMFTLNRKSVIKTCQLLRELDFPVRWHCSARLDCIDPELIDIMVESGMKRIFIGIETGSPRMQKLVNKNLDLSNAVSIISYIVEKGCDATASFIFGFPEETEEDLSQTMALIGQLLKLRTITIQTHLCTFLAGTELSARYQSEMTRTNQRSDITGDLFLSECSDLVDAHPELFSHMLEYRTPLRTRLQYFPLFFRFWKKMQPVYQYLSEKYPENRLIDMYYDFIGANDALLKEIPKISSMPAFREFASRDNFPEKFKDDENYDLIKDIYRYKLAEADAELNGEAESCETYCFNPTNLRKSVPLQDYGRCIAIVRRSNKKASIQIYSK